MQPDAARGKTRARFPYTDGVIRAEALEKRFGDVVAVDGLSLDVPAGRTIGLLGPNGAGKTTAISMMTGLIAPDAGGVAIDGGDPRRPAVRRTIGVCPQALAVYPELSARRNLAFFAELAGLRGARVKERVAWALGFAGLESRAGGLVKTFSGGMQRRLNLACALVHDPPVLFCDEPTVGIDPQSRNHIYESIERLKADGRTIVYTTHYMEEAQRLCDEVAIIDGGRILARGGVADLIAEHGGASVVVGALAEPPPPGVGAPELDGLAFRMECERPIERITELAGAGVRFAGVRVASPDLESVFLTLTGRRLRDD